MSIDLELWAHCDGPDCQRKVKSSQYERTSQYERRLSVQAHAKMVEDFQERLVGLSWIPRYGNWYCCSACQQESELKRIQQKFVVEWHQSLQDVCAENGFEVEDFARELMRMVMVVKKTGVVMDDREVESQWYMNRVNEMIVPGEELSTDEENEKEG